jgi:hypothetical protein
VILAAGIDIMEEPRGETYRALLRFAAARCQTFSLVWRDQLAFKPAALDIAAVLEPYLVAHFHTDTWPGTHLLGHKAAVRQYRLEPATLAVLEAAEGLYSWQAPDLPEDIAFYMPDSVSLWLGTISHEADAWFADPILSRDQILRHVPGIVFAPES